MKFWTKLILTFLLTYFFTNSVYAKEACWKHNLGLVFLTVSDDTRNQSLGIRGKNIRFKDSFRLTLNTAIYYNRAEGQTELDNWLVNVKEEFLSWEEFYLYDIFGIIADKYLGINYGYSGQGGVGYYLLKEERDELRGEFGLDYTSEKQVDISNKKFISGRFFIEYIRIVTKTILFNSSFDYLRDFEDDENWRSNGEVFVTTKLRDKFSLKTGVHYKFRNLPVGEKAKTKIQASTALNIDF